MGLEVGLEEKSWSRGRANFVIILVAKECLWLAAQKCLCDKSTQNIYNGK